VKMRKMRKIISLLASISLLAFNVHSDSSRCGAVLTSVWKYEGTNCSVVNIELKTGFIGDLGSVEVCKVSSASARTAYSQDDRVFFYLAASDRTIYRYTYPALDLATFSLPSNLHTDAILAMEYMNSLLWLVTPSALYSVAAGLDGNGTVSEFAVFQKGGIQPSALITSQKSYGSKIFIAESARLMVFETASGTPVALPVAPLPLTADAASLLYNGDTDMLLVITRQSLALFYNSTSGTLLSHLPLPTSPLQSAIQPPLLIVADSQTIYTLDLVANTTLKAPLQLSSLRGPFQVHL